MINKLRIINYQSWKDSIFEFTKGINVIIGSSDAGKSAIIRAIRKLVFNRPLGDSFIRKGAKECIIEMETDNGRAKRVIGEDSYYKINDSMYRSVGTDVPDTIDDVLCISDINLQRQLDKHFLVLGTGGEIASKLNEVLKINEIDSSITYCAKRIKSFDKEAALLQNQYKVKKEELEKYDGLDELIKEINDWQKGVLERESVRTRLDNVHYLIVDILEVDDKIEELKGLDIVIELAKDVEKLADNWDKMQNKKQKIVQIRYELNNGNKELNGLKELPAIENLIGIMNNIMGEYTKIRKRGGDIVTVLTGIEQIEVASLSYDIQISKLKKERKGKEEEYEKVLKDMKACPFCKRPITVEVSKKLISNL